MQYLYIMDSIFKQTLRAEMDFQDIKVKELACKTGISPRTLEGYLGNRTSIPPADIAVKIATALNVTVEYLVTGKKIKTQKKNTDESHLTYAIDNLDINTKLLLKDVIELLDKYDIKKNPH